MPYKLIIFFMENEEVIVTEETVNVDFPTTEEVVSDEEVNTGDTE